MIDETFAPAARLKYIRSLLAYAAQYGIKLFQMDVKSIFLNCVIEEKVFVKQRPSVDDVSFPIHVFKFSKIVYGLKKAPKAWYDRISYYLRLC